MPRRLLALSILMLALADLSQALNAHGTNREGQGQSAEAKSLLGRELFSPPVAPEARSRMEKQLADARAVWDKNRDDVDALIWVGRRTAYLGRFREAIAIYTEGIKAHPNDPRLYRHRGHRYLTVREIEPAIADFEKAVSLITANGGQPDAIEPDGQPNARNIPTSTLHSNIYYHLALGYYLRRDFVRAAENWGKARDVVRNADNLVAASNWLYLSLRRAGQTEAAAEVLRPIDARLDVIENGSYHSLLLMYKGERTPEDVLKAAGEGSSGTAVRYGVSAWYLINGKRAEASRLWAQILEGTDWPSFGHLAAEAEVR
jgi:tetratricopeptide (TPR) repeat protein